MTPDQINRVRAAVKSQQAKGVTVKDGDWYVDLDVGTMPWYSRDETPCACPMGCLLLEEQPGLGLDQESSAACVLGVSFKAIGAFTNGFDGEDLPWPSQFSEYRDWWDAGRELRKELGLDQEVAQ